MGREPSDRPVPLPPSSDKEAWRRLEASFARALGLRGPDRTAFLAEMAADDPGTAEELAELLAAHDANQGGVGTLPEAVDPDRAVALLDDDLGGRDVPPSSRLILGRYRMVRRIGRGGMGIVYLARDRTLDRLVALKILSPHLGADPAARDRFLREARAASSLDHPHIATIFEAGFEAGLEEGGTEDPTGTQDPTGRQDPAEKGRLFIAMAYCPGPTLRDRIAGGPLPVADAVRVAAQAASGIAAAHARGIIHRDVKPENLIDTPELGVRVVDFGVAKVAGSLATAAGGAMGTVAYMSPEQSRGEGVDHRTDIWALGVLLYEMLTGERPFGGGGDAVVIHAIRHDPAPDLSRIRPDVPPALATVVERALAKQPDGRFTSAEEMATALRALSESRGPHFPLRRSLPRGRRRVAAMALALGLGVAYLAFLAPTSRGVPPPGSILAEGHLTDRDPIVLADFSATLGDPGMGRVITEALRIDLLQSPAFRVADASEVADALRRMERDPASGVPEAAALQVAVREGMKAVIAGDVAALGEGFVLTARVLASADGTLLAGVRETAGDATGLIEAVDRLSKSLREEIGEPLRSLRAADPLPRVATASLPALERYAEAYALAWSGGDQVRTMELLEEAVALDSLFAAAYRTLAATYWNLRAERSRTVEATRRAFSLRHRLPPLEQALVEAMHHWQLLGNPPRAAEAYRRVLAQDPDNLAALNNLALALLLLDRPVEAEPLARRGMELSPHPLLRINLAESLFMQDRTEEALELLASESRVHGRHPGWELARVRMLGGEGRWEEAESVSRGLLEEHRDNAEVRVNALRGLWHLALVQGRLAEAEEWYGALAGALEETGSLDGLARVEAQRAEAILWLEGDTSRARQAVPALSGTSPDELAAASASLAPRAAATLAALGDTARARSLVERWEALPEEDRADPAPFSPALARARTAWASGRAESAVSLLEEAVSDNLQSIYYLPDLARTRAGIGRPEEAIADIRAFVDHRHPRRLHRIPPYHGPLLLELGRLLEEAGQVEDARDAYQELLDLWAGADPSLSGRLAEARAGLQRLTRR
jgi:serine/threonine protein kinase/tetratricopeptide (TPR) repeat protein